MKSASEIAQEVFKEFNEAVQNLPKEEYWEVAAELSAMLEGVLMEKEEREGRD